MKKSLHFILIMLLLGVLILSCNSGDSQPAEETGVDSSGVNPNEEAVTVDSAAAMPDTGNSMPSYRTEDRDQKKGREQTKQGEKTRKTQAIQQ